MMIDGPKLRDACGDRALDGGLTIKAVLEPLAGPGAPVAPAIYAGGVYQRDRRWHGEGESREAVDVIVIDNVPSQANRLEAALERLRPELGLPELVLDLSAIDELPAHVPRQLSSFRWPHRQADAYLRDAAMDGTPFPRHPVGKALLSATGDDPLALLEWVPQALLFGFWQSHLGKKGLSQAKLARSWTSEIVGYRPAVGAETRKKLGLKGDPLNLNVDEPVTYDEDDLLRGWNVVEGGARTAGRKTKETLAELGHGQVPVPDSEAAPAAVSFAAIEQQSTVSFASLRARVRADGAEQSAAARAMLAALGLVAHAGAFSGAFSLRSGCDLRPRATWSRWLGAHGDDDLDALDLGKAVDLFRACVAQAEQAGLPVGSHWAAEPLVLRPGKSLESVIRKTYFPLAEAG